MPTTQPVYLVSSCLLGLCTRYDGKVKQYPLTINKLKTATLIPICPEQLGGLATPREAAVLTGGDGNDVLNGHATIVTKSGVDVTAKFILGAQQVLKIAQMQKISSAVLKSRSPSCGVSENIGVAAALLQRHGIQTIEVD